MFCRPNMKGLQTHLSRRWRAKHVLSVLIAQAGPREILQNGALGCLVPVGDWQALGDAILKTLNNPVETERLIEGTSEYSAESSIQRYYSLVWELCQRTRHG